MSDLISRKDAIDALWKALYEYEDKTERQFQESENLDVGDWVEHRIFVQNMSDIDRQTIRALPSAEPERIIKIGQRSGITLESAIDYLHSVGWLQEHDRILTESAEPERRWIPVTERLPEEETDVLVTVHFDGYKSEYTYYPPSDYVEIASHIEGVWSSLSDEYKAVEVNHHVVAWMPLPEPCRGE